MPLEQVIGSAFTRFLPAPQQSSFKHLIEQSGNEGTKAEFLMKAAAVGAPAEFPAGSPVADMPVQLSVRPLSGGPSAGCCIVVTDLTEQRQAQAALRAERQRLFTVLETVPAMVCLLTPDYQIPFANRAFRRKFGESDGRRCYEYCFGRDAPCDFCQSYQVLKTGQPHQWEVSGPDGSVIESHDFPFTDVDGSPMILEMDIDITARRRAEEKIRDLNATLERRVVERTAELAAANQELEALAYSMAHDLRAPLRGLDGFSLALAEDYGPKLDEQARSYIRRIRAAATHMGRLIDDMLALLQLSRREAQRQKVDLSALAWAVASELRRSEPKREVEFVIPPGLTVEGDARLLQIVLEKLLDNAWKFTGPRPHARIELGVTEHKGEKAYFVCDNGVGFDMAYAGKLFAPFWRLHAADAFPGTGIGLTSVERIVRKHWGKVWAEGKVDEGATFFFTLGK
jgi:signal transduction histidine kinase